MKIDKALISKLEKLARLELSEPEQDKLVTDLSSILKMVEKLEEVDTSNVAPLSYITETVNALREDKVAHQLDRDKALSNAPNQDGKFFKVPKVINLKSNN